MISTVQYSLADADSVHDRFHGSTYLNDVVDKTRKQESRQLSKQGDKTLVGSKFSWLRNPDSAQKATFDLLMEAELKTGVAWSIKNGFRTFLNLLLQKHAELFFWVMVGHAVSERQNRTIKVLASAAREVRSCENYRIRILFFCGKLNIAKSLGDVLKKAVSLKCAKNQ